MRLVRLLPDRWQKFIHEALKFGIVGGANAVINYAVFNALALTIYQHGQLKANVIATIVATITSYLMNRHWTFRDRPKSAVRREYLLFFLFNAVGLLIELGVLALAKYGLGITGLLALNIAKTGGVGLATLFRFWSYRTFVFQPATPASTADTVTDLDPVAELAEAVTEFEESEAEDLAGKKHEPASNKYAKPQRHPLANGAAAFAQRVKPLKVQLAESIDVDLDAELAVELNAASRRRSSR